MTRFIRAEGIRACLEAELLTDVEQRLTLLSRDMDNRYQEVSGIAVASA
jgi:hypothetical protein